MTGSVSYPAALLSLFPLLASPAPKQPKTTEGITVLLCQPCPTGMEDNRRDVVVRVLPREKLWVNDQQVDEALLRSMVSIAMERRVEKLVSIAADERVAYGEVLRLASGLTQATPDLHIAIETKSQTGPVDPEQIEVFIHKYGKDPQGESLCVYP